jgi:antitoxin (DNA-binding transcriptional repressor) of toxin-antitoxin stability system
MTKMTVRQVRSALPRLEEVVSREGEIVITRRGLAVARVLPMQAVRRAPSHAALRARMPLLSPSAPLIREDREGRC